jgi:hypothetical protein
MSPSDSPTTAQSEANQSEGSSSKSPLQKKPIQYLIGNKPPETPPSSFMDNTGAIQDKDDQLSKKQEIYTITSEKRLKRFRRFLTPLETSTVSPEISRSSAPEQSNTSTFSPKDSSSSPFQDSSPIEQKIRSLRRTISGLFLSEMKQEEIIHIRTKWKELSQKEERSIRDQFHWKLHSAHKELMDSAPISYQIWEEFKENTMKSILEIAPKAYPYEDNVTDKIGKDLEEWKTICNAYNKNPNKLDNHQQLKFNKYQIRQNAIIEYSNATPQDQELAPSLSRRSKNQEVSRTGTGTYIQIPWQTYTPHRDATEAKVLKEGGSGSKTNDA